jgi:hypothetical protein
MVEIWITASIPDIPSMITSVMRMSGLAFLAAEIASSPLHATRAR